MSAVRPAIPRLIDWLYAEFRDDLTAGRQWSARDWVREAVVTALIGGLALRAMVYACVHAINHAPASAVMHVSTLGHPVTSVSWRRHDSIQATLLCWWLLAWGVTPLVSLPTEPTTAAIVALQAVPLAVDPLLK